MRKHGHAITEDSAAHGTELAIDKILGMDEDRVFPLKFHGGDFVRFRIHDLGHAEDFDGGINKSDRQARFRIVIDPANPVDLAKVCEAAQLIKKTDSFGGDDF